MTIPRITTECIAVMLAIAQLTFGSEATRKRVQSESTELSRFGPNGMIRVSSTSGDLIVEGWDRQELEVTVVKWIDHEFEPRQINEATQRLESVKINVGSHLG